MTDKKEQIKQLLARLDKMVECQGYFFREIKLIREEISKLEAIQPTPTVAAPSEIPKKPMQREDISFYKPPPPKQKPAAEPIASERKLDYQSNYQAPEKPKIEYQPNYQSREKSDFGSSVGSRATFDDLKERILQKSGVEEFVAKT